MDNKKLEKALIKTLDDLSPLIFLIFIAIVASVVVGLFMLIGFWGIPVLAVAAICVTFLYNYFGL